MDRNISNETDVVQKGVTFNYYMTEQRIFLMFLLVMILIGNSIVLLAVAVSRRKSRMNFFIKQLAIADLLVGVFSVLPDLVWRFTMTFLAGEIMCKIVKFFMATVTYGSTFVLVALSIDRLDAIARPLGFSDSWKRPRIMIAVCWILALIYAVPMLILFKGDYCMINLTEKQWQIYISVVAMLVFFIPAIIIGICYGAMIFIMWRLNRRPKPEKNKVTESGDLLSQNGQNGFQNKRYPHPLRIRGRETSMSSRGIIPQAKVRTIKMTFVIILVFILCWSPYFIWNLLTVFKVIKLSQTNIAISAFIQSLAPLNSAANPIIYGVFSTRICRQLRRIRFMKIVLDTFGCCMEDPNSGRKRITEPYSTDYSTNYSHLSKSRTKPHVTFEKSRDTSSDRTLDGREMNDFVLKSIKA